MPKHVKKRALQNFGSSSFIMELLISGDLSDVYRQFKSTSAWENPTDYRYWQKKYREQRLKEILNF
jgi:hypothetical protein